MTIKSSQEVLIGTSTITANGGILQLKSGITFPATAVAASDANTLDDYEEGTFTPTIGGSIADGTPTYTNQVGVYTKIGNLLFFSIFLQVSGKSGLDGSISIKNLPFTSSSTGITAVCSTMQNGIALTGGATQLSGRISASTTAVELLSHGAVTYNGIDDADINVGGSGMIVVLSGSYRVA